LLIHQSRLAAMGEMIAISPISGGNRSMPWGSILANIEDAFIYQELSGEYLAKQVEDGTRLIQKMSSTIDDFRNFFPSL